MSNFSRIQVLNGPTAGYYEIPEDGKLSIGRSEKCDVKVTGKVVSREHCFFEHTRKRDHLVNKSSTITFLNGHAVENAELTDGDVITVGTTLIVYIAADQKQGLAPGSQTAVEGHKRVSFFESYPPAKMLGQTCGNTTLLGVLSSREMMDVYLGYRYETRSLAAVKMLGDKSGVPEPVYKRFERGTAHFQELKHPNLPRFHARGEIDGRIFTSVGFVDGNDLSSLLKEEGKVAPSKALELGVHTAKLLEFLEQEELVLRNICPENLMIAREGEGKVVNLDYTTKSGTEETSQDAFAGASSGVLNHRAPEYSGQACEANPLSDQFSLASVMYTCISGGKTPWQKSDGSREPFSTPPLSLNEHVSDLNPFVWACLQVALEPDPSKRYGSSHEFRLELEAALKSVS